MNGFGLRIDEAAVRIYPPGIEKHEALESLIDAIDSTGVVLDRASFAQALHDREKVMSTGIGSGVAIPHVRIDALTAPAMGVGISHEGIDFGTLDNKPVHIVILFAMPTGSQKMYLGLLAQVMTAMKQPGLRDSLAGANTAEEVVRLLNG